MKRDNKNRNTRGLQAALVAVLLLAVGSVQAESYRSGQHIEPAYEGWKQREDGSYDFYFGYHNENWEEQLDITVGEENFFSPGDIDRGQPTRFLPRRNRFTFTVNVPEDWGDRELSWTVRSPSGEERTAYATLARDYVIDNVVIASETGSLGAGTSTPESRANQPPQVSVLGDGIRRVRVNEPMELRALVQDDGLPTPGRAGSGSGLARGDSGGSVEARMNQLLRAPSRVTVGKTNGLFLSWNVYRGPGEAVFDPPQVKPWEDTRTGANSPWSALWAPPPVPEDGVYRTRVTFSEPGQYILWGRADDGGLYDDVYMTVTVTE